MSGYKPLTIKSVNESCDDVTIIGETLELGPTIEIISHNVSIIGFRVLGSSKISSWDGETMRSKGIMLDSARNCYIANCSIQACKLGVYIDHASGNIIKHNNIRWSDLANILIGSNSANNTILNNTIYGSHCGINNLDSNTSIIANNTVYNNSWRGINLCLSSNAIIAGNTIYANQWGGVSLYNSNISAVSNNTVFGSNSFLGSFGIKLEESNNNTVKDNTVTENGDGIKLYNETDSTITGNNVSYNKNDGIYVERSICEIRHNTVCWNGEWGIHAINSSESTIEENICEDNGIE